MAKSDVVVRIQSASREAEDLARQLWPLLCQTFENALAVADEILEEGYFVLSTKPNPFNGMVRRSEIRSMHPYPGAMAWVKRITDDEEFDWAVLGILPSGQSRCFLSVQLFARPRKSGIEVAFGDLVSTKLLPLEAWSPENTSGSRAVLRKMMEEGLEHIVRHQSSDDVLRRLTWRGLEVENIETVGRQGSRGSIGFLRGNNPTK